MLYQLSYAPAPADISLVPQRRLFASYFGTFAVIIALFAIAVELSFVSNVRLQATHRLITLARAGAAAVLFTRSGFVVDDASLGGFDVDPRTEGLEWFDAARRLKTQRGRQPASAVVPDVGRASLRGPGGTRLETYTLVLHDGRGTEVGYVRALLTSDAFNQGIVPLNIGIFLGSLIAVVAASIGGTLLARAAIARTESGFRRLQEFTADASHELRSPLAALSATAAVALRESPDMPGKTRKRLQAILSAGKDMQRLVDDLLLLARAGRSLEREMFAVRVDKVIRDVHNRYQSSALLKFLDFRITSTVSSQVIGNPDQVTRIVANLVENAIRYTPSGGAVYVACSEDSTSVTIAVEDTGIGISRDQLTRVFDRFWRGDAVRRSDGGSGLGLSIARALAERHGGRISVASSVESGSTFTLTLPRRPSAIG